MGRGYGNFDEVEDFEESFESSYIMDQEWQLDLVQSCFVLIWFL
jgi:hypothetical protein